MIAGLTAIVAMGATAAQGALPSLSLSTGAGTASSSSSSSSAGQPVATNVLLCGTFQPGMDRFSGNSDIDHPSGSSAMGMEYDYTGTNNCEAPGSSNGNFSWTITHSNVNTTSERGTEHGLYTLTTTGGQPGGFNGRITDYDLPQGDPIVCGNRNILYASGHAYDPCGQPSAPGNFNTHGGAQDGNHFRGMYGTLVYQHNDMELNDPCPSGSSSYCFEAVLKGQTN